jgi:HEAT repeat protein
MQGFSAMSAEPPPPGKGDQSSPAQLFDQFRKRNYQASRKALRAFEEVPDKSRFLQPAVQFLHQEENDQIRSWGTNVLEHVGGKRAFEALLDLFRSETTSELRSRYRYTRFFALRALARLARSEGERAVLTELLEELWANPWQQSQEDYLVQAEAAVLLALQGRVEPLSQVRAMLRAFNDDFWITWAALRALREFPLPDVAEEILAIMRSASYPDHRHDAIRALGGYTDNVDVVHELSSVARTSNDSHLRLAAVHSLGQLRHRESQDTLLRSLADENAEIRVQAAIALQSALSKAEAISLIVQRALSEETPRETWEYLLDALRRIDSDRLISAEVLNKELGGEDRRRSQAAEDILIELGGWAAVQRLSQHRNTLESLDQILAESEQVVKSTFKDTIRQARLNFYFAMGANVLVLLVGLTLIVMAIVQLAQQPEKLEGWIVPGGAGLLGVLINLAFNDPRRNAREDLTSLMNVNVIFLGFLRQLNEIDATFKHAYIERHGFGASDMRETVQQIEAAVTQALDMAARHLRIPPEVNGTRLIGKGRHRLPDQPAKA